MLRPLLFLLPVRIRARVRARVVTSATQRNISQKRRWVCTVCTCIIGSSQVAGIWIGRLVWGGYEHSYSQTISSPTRPWIGFLSNPILKIIKQVETPQKNDSAQLQSSIFNSTCTGIMFYSAGLVILSYFVVVLVCCTVHSCMPVPNSVGKITSYYW